MADLDLVFDAFEIDPVDRLAFQRLIKGSATRRLTRLLQTRQNYKDVLHIILTRLSQPVLETLCQPTS